MLRNIVEKYWSMKITDSQKRYIIDNIIRNLTQTQYRIETDFVFFL